MELDASQRKEYIILNAVELISEKGMNNISTKEIARRLNISESLIFKLFPKKNDLLMGVLEHFSFYDKDMFYTAINKNENSLEAIRFYINSYMIYYENYPAVIAVYQSYDSLKGDALLEEKAERIFSERINDLTALIRKAQENELIHSTVNAEDIATILSSVMRGLCIKWRISEYSYSLKEKVKDATDLILDAIRMDH